MAITIKIEHQPRISKELYKEFLEWKRGKENAEYLAMLEESLKQAKNGELWELADGEIVRPSIETIKAVQGAF